MSIRSNIEAIMAQVADGDTELGDEIQSEAVSAIKAGQGSEAWETYMIRFGKSPAELARLLATDSTSDDFEMDVARTTLVGNGTCGAITVGSHLLDGIDDKLDENLG